jgi:hypothetical protein
MSTTENGSAEAVEVQPVEPAPVLVPAPIIDRPGPIPSNKHPAFVAKMTREEFLEMENLSIKTQNLAMQEKQLQADIIKANEMRRSLQATLEAKHTELSAKYGVNVMARTTQILEDGSIMDMTRLQPKAPPPPAPPQASAKPGN